MMNNKSKSRSVFPRHNHNKPTVSLSNIHYIQMCYTVDYNQPGLLRLMLASGTDHNPFLNFLYQDFNLKLISNTIRLPPWLHGWAARLVMGGVQDFCAKLHGNRKQKVKNLSWGWGGHGGSPKGRRVLSWLHCMLDKVLLSLL